MDQIRVGRPNDFVAGGSQAQAEIDVTEIDAKIHLVESIELLENFRADGHAGSGHRRAVLLQKRAIVITGMPSWNARKSVTRQAAHPEHYAAVLKRSVGIPKPGSHRSHSRSGGMTYHFREPAAVFDLDIVVEEQEYFAVGLGSSEIV